MSVTGATCKLRLERDDGPSLLGRDWLLRYTKVNWRSVLSMSSSTNNTSAWALEALLDVYFVQFRATAPAMHSQVECIVLILPPDVQLLYADK